MVNTTPLSSHNIMINQPKNQNGTASYLLRTLKSIPESTQCKAKQNCTLAMSILLMCFLELSNKNLMLNCLAVISVLYSFTQKSSNDHAIQFKHKKMPTGVFF